MIGVRLFLRHVLAGLRLLLALTILLGFGYPLAVAGLARLAPWQADGSLLTDDGSVVGSRLIAQPTDDSAWFRSRPSASADDALTSGGSNLGPESPDLTADVRRRRAHVAQEEGVEASAVPADAVTASASGLDPDISPAYARIQAARVARAQGLPPALVTELVERHVRDRTWGFVGAPHVNVLELNLAVRRLAAGDGGRAREE